MGNPESPWSCPVSLSLLTPWLHSFHLCALFLPVGPEHLCASLTFHGFVPRVLVCLSHCPHLPPLCLPSSLLHLLTSYSTHLSLLCLLSLLCRSPPLPVCISLLVYCLNLLNSHSSIFTTFSALLLHVFLLLSSPHSCLSLLSFFSFLSHQGYFVGGFSQF